MMQADLFAPTVALRRDPPVARVLDVSGLLDRLTAICERPRYNFMLLSLISEAGAATGRAGPFVKIDGREIAIRDWLCDAMNPVGRREPRRLRMAIQVRDELAAAGALPEDPVNSDKVVDAEVRCRLRRSGRTNVSRAVSELVRAGLLKRHYQGYRVDHHNRGAQRQAVYTVTEEVRRVFATQR